MPNKKNDQIEKEIVRMMLIMLQSIEKMRDMSSQLAMLGRTMTINYAKMSRLIEEKLSDKE